jgi:hypothetical protein
LIYARQARDRDRDRGELTIRVNRRWRRWSSVAGSMNMRRARRN